MFRKLLALATAALCTALFVTGCGEGDDVKTVFFVRIERGNAPGAIHRIDLEVNRNGATFMVPLENADKSELALPITREVKLPDDQSGAVIVTAHAIDAAMSDVGTARTPGTIVPGETITLVLEFGVDKTMLDGGVPPDAEVDAEILSEAQLTVTPTTRDFGSAVLGTSSAATVFTVQNSGQRATGPLMLALTGASASSFAIEAGSNCVGASLAGGASCTASVIFTPGAAGPASAALEITGTPGGTATVMLAGSGLRPGEISISPLTANLGSTVLNQMSAVRSFTVENMGEAATGALTATLGGSDAGQFAIAQNGCTTLAARATCTIDVRLLPTSTGSKSATLTVTGTPGGSAVAQLSGVGLAIPALSIAPTTQNLGTVVQGNQASVTFSVANAGGAATGSLTTTLSGTAASEYALVTNGCAGSPLAAGASCSVTVRLTAATLGARPVTLTVAATPGGSAIANVTANVVLQGALRVTPGSASFGSVLLGQDSAVQSFTVSNTGGVNTTTPTAVLSGSAAGDFRIASNTCTGPVTPTGTCTITVVMRPSLAGGRAASLDLSATTGGNTAASLSGTGLNPALLVGDATMNAFGTVDVTQQSSVFTWTVRNTGDVATSALSFAVTGDASQFTVVNMCTGTLAAGGSCTITVRFVPTAAGNAAISVNLSAATGGSVALAATGTGRALLRLIVNKAGTGTGTVTATGINCGADCFEDYLYNTPVTLAAAPTAGSATFGGWSGACTGTGACAVTMSVARTVTATFVLNRYALNVTAPSNGSIATVGSALIACPGDCTETYDHGTSVVLRATPVTGYAFGSWGGACAGQTGDCTVAMTAVRTVSASFTITQRDLRLTSGANGTTSISPVGTSCGAGCSRHNYGTVVTVTAAPSPGYVAAFTGCTPTSATTCTVAMTADQSVAVSYTITQRDLTLTSGANGSATISPAGTSCGAGCSRHDYGTVVTVTAAPNAGYVAAFTGCTPTSATTCTVAMTANQSVSVSYTITQRDLRLTSTGSGTTTISPTGTSCGAGCSRHDYGTVVTITAAPSTGYTHSFSGCTVVTPTTCTVAMTADRSASVSYTITTRDLTVTSSGSGITTVNPTGASCGTNCSRHNYDTPVTITAAPSPGYTHTFGGACTGVTATTCNLRMTSDQSVTVTYTITTRDLLLTSSASGGVTSVNPTGTACGTGCRRYNYGTAVTITAAPSANYQYTFGGACSGSGTTTGTCNLTLNSIPAVNTSVTVSYSLIPRTLTVTAGTGGSVSVSPSGTANCGANCQSYPHGSSVTITATPSLGYVVSGWTGACANSINTCTLTMNSNLTTAVSFAVQTTTLTIAPPSVGSISGPGFTCTPNNTSCVYSFGYFDQITISANAPASHEAYKWGGDCGAFGGAVNCNLNMTANRSAAHSFIPKFILRVSAPQGGGTPSASTGVSCGTGCYYIPRSDPRVTISANPDPWDQDFVTWRGDVVSSNESVALTLTQDTTAEAYYTQAPSVTLNLNAGQVAGVNLYDTTRKRTLCQSATGANTSCVAYFPRRITFYHVVARPNNRWVNWDFGGFTPPRGTDANGEPYIDIYPAQLVTGNRYNVYAGFR
ncbi:MAG: choice-of-anchor D domain-containing protein [Deltaproteobacteria bacterium]|nr:choice-of-anchor D domain-containing protein [Deltaproteobacteria bacterium]